MDLKFEYPRELIDSYYTQERWEDLSSNLSDLLTWIFLSTLFGLLLFYLIQTIDAGIYGLMTFALWFGSFVIVSYVLVSVVSRSPVFSVEVSSKRIKLSYEFPLMRTSFPLDSIIGVKAQKPFEFNAATQHILKKYGLVAYKCMVMTGSGKSDLMIFVQKSQEPQLASILRTRQKIGAY